MQERDRHNGELGDGRAEGRGEGRGERGLYTRTTSPAEIERVLKRRAEERLAGDGGLGLSGLCVEGTLGETDGLKRYGRKIYGAKLADGAGEAFGAGASLDLAVPAGLEDRLRELEYCRVVVKGDLEVRPYKSAFSFQLNVRALEAAGEDPSGEQRQAEKSLAAVLRGYRRRPRGFPATGAAEPNGPVRLLVLHPATGVTLRDFAEGLGEVPTVSPAHEPVPTNDPKAMLEAVRRARGARPDVLVMVRGGGAPEDLMPFNDPALAEAWMNFPAYTISAVGHAQDATVLDAVSDAACPTPTAAGAFVRQQALEAARADEEARRAARRDAEVRELARGRSAARKTAVVLGAACVLLLLFLLMQLLPA